jgi:type II secretory pathway component PulC
LFGAWAATQLWPHWISAGDKANGLSQATPEVVLAPDVRDAGAMTSLLGTDSSAREGRVSLTLFAIQPAKLPNESTASLGADARNPQVYAVGSTLMNGMTLREIHPDHVVLLNGSRKISLELNETIHIANEPSASVVDTVASSRDDLSEVVRPEMVYENDRLSGLRILPGSRPELLRLLGLEAGDIVRSVDGKQVVNDKAWQTIDDALSTGTPIVVGIERAGALIVFSLDGSKLSQS